MRFKLLFVSQLFFLALGVFSVEAQEHCISGVVRDKITRQPVADVHVWDARGSQGTITDSSGRFDICSSETGERVLMFSHTAYEMVTRGFEKTVPGIVAVWMKPKEYQAGEVEVTGQRSRANHDVAPGQVKLQSSDVLKMPALLGEADVVRALQQMTGVQSVSEGVGGIFVRGGGAGQNRVVLDGMELMNPTHLMGVYSVFNPLITSGVDVFKGHTPVALRGGLSSSILVSSTDPFSARNQFNGSVGNIASNLTFSGHTENGKLGVTAGVRRSYLELHRSLAALFLADEENYFSRAFYRFYDFNGQIKYRPRDFSALTLSWYLGADDFTMQNTDAGYDAATNYGNRAVALDWRSRLGGHAALSAGISYSGTWSDFAGEVINHDIEFKSHYQRVSGEAKITIEKERHLFRAGADISYYETVPQDLFLDIPGNPGRHEDRFQNSGLSFFLEDTWALSPLVKLYGGARVFYYLTMGPYRYEQEGFVESLAKDEFSEGSLYWAPSFSVSYHRSSGSVFKLAWSRNIQAIHLATLGTMPLPNDIWMMSSPRLEPQTGHQFSFEHERALPGLVFTSGLFARLMRNQLIFNPNVGGEEMNFEDHFFHGKGRAYGMELAAKKEAGLFQGSVNYTLSRSERSFPAIYSGDWFTYKFDRSHDLSLIASRELNKKWSLGANWTYATGNAMTLPSGRMWMMGTIMNDYDGYNNFRLPAYHRLDLSASLRLESEWFEESVLDFSVINVYNRANPYYIYYKVYQGDSNFDIDIRASQVSLFPVMPSISWKFKF